MSNHHYAAIVGLAIVNGIFSPALAIVFALNFLWYPFFLPPLLPLIFALSSLIVSTLTLMIAGVPAAIYERLARSGGTNAVSGAIWFAATLALTLPAIPAIVKALS